MKREVDIVVLSDVQLGSKGCKAKELLNYLDSIKVGTLILNGDFIKCAELKKKNLPKVHLDIVQRVLELASTKTKVYYIVGDEDAPLKKYTNFESGNLHIRDNLYLQLKGKSYWLFHGDVLDFMLLSPVFNFKSATNSYKKLVWYNSIHRKFSRFFGLSAIHKNTSKTSNYIQQFEEKVFQTAYQQNCDYVICGHTNQPQMKTSEIKGKKITYLNAGDWQKNLTSLEYKWGRWSIFEYDPLDYSNTNHFLDEDPKVEIQNTKSKPNNKTTQFIEDLLKIRKSNAA